MDVGEGVDVGMDMRAGVHGRQQQEAGAAPRQRTHDGRD